MDTCQASDGYLWLATLDGLVRFDGVRFTVFDHSSTPGIQGNQFNSVYCSPSGDVWAGSGSTGVTRYSHGVFATYNSEGGLPAEFESRLTGDSAGHLWAYAGGRIFQWDPASSHFIPAPGMQTGYSGNADASGSFSSVSHGELQIFSKGEIKRYRLPTEPEWQVPRMVARDMNGTVWICDLRARLRYLKKDGIGWSKPIIPSEGNRQSRTFTYQVEPGMSLTFVVDYQYGGNLQQMLFLSSGEKSDGLPVNNLLQDHEGSLWVATNGRGLSRIRRQVVTTLSAKDGLPDGNVYPIYQDHTGDIWIGSGGLARYHDGKVVPFSTAGGLQSKRVISIGEDNQGQLWVATYKGLYQGTDGHFRLANEHVFEVGAAIQIIFQDPQGALWFGTSRGLVEDQKGEWTTFHRKDGLATDDVRVLLRGRSGDLWIGGYGGLTRWSKGHVERWTEAEGLPSNSIRCLYEDKEGVLWIGTYDGGLARLEEGHLTSYGVKDGLFSSGVFQILEDDKGYFWMSSNRGIYRVAKRELNLFAHGELKMISSVSYGKADGMRNEECNGGISPAGIRTTEGKLWFPTQDGVAIIDPNEVQPALRAPPVVIESLTVDRVRQPLDRAIRIAPGQDNVEIAYTAPSLIDPEQIRFRYRLTGLDRDWVGASGRRTAYSAHLPPGEYDFKVIAASGAGAWNSNGATVHISVLPRFYQTSWFTWLTAAVIASILTLAWKIRTLQYERAAARQQAISGLMIASQEGERKRIAAELHDSLGQHLLLIKNWAALALRESGRSGQQQSLVNISDTAALAIQEVREISRNLRPAQLERLGLTTAIKDLVQQIAGSSAIDFTARIADLDGSFTPDAEMSIYRICQEGLNNILRHSEAEEAWIHINREGDDVDIVIGDNGRGFTPDAHPGSAPGNAGFGLVGIAERARTLGGSLTVTSSPGSGTVLRISLESQGRNA